MCDGKPYLCSTCHNRFDCEKLENRFYKNHLRDIPFHSIKRITLKITADEKKYGEYLTRKGKQEKRD